MQLHLSTKITKYVYIRTIAGKTLTMNIANNPTISNLIKMCSEKTECEYKHIILKGKRMDMDKHIHEYNIELVAIIHIV